MAFDHHPMHRGCALGCLGIVCGLVAPAIGKLFGWWWSLVPLGIPFALLLFVLWIEWRRRRS
jgi:hypothetical protein